MTERAGPWIEVGDRVFARRYAFIDQQISVVLGGGAALLVDTGLTQRIGGEIRDDIRELTADPVAIVVNTHWHRDHTFGNHVFRPATIWGHARCPGRLLEHGERMRADIAERAPELAGAMAELVIDPPDQTFADAVDIEVGGRRIELRYLGRGHTDTDIVLHVPDAAVLLAGDLLEADATPYFGDGYPLDWPATVTRMLPLATGAVVPGHGTVGDAGFVRSQLSAFEAIASLGRRVAAGELDLDAAVAASPFSPATSGQPIERAAAQARGELGPDPTDD